MNKKDLIIKVYEKLLQEELNTDISISRIAKEANIAKGGVYYYFLSKEEILDAVIEKNYLIRINKALKTIDVNIPAKDKLVQLFKNYIHDDSTKYLDKALHSKSNAYMHQKSLVFIVRKFSEIISDILNDGIDKREFPKLLSKKDTYAIALLLMGTLTFIMDNNLFPELKSEEYKIAELAFSNFSNGIGLKENIIFEVIKNENKI